MRSDGNQIHSAGARSLRSASYITADRAEEIASVGMMGMDLSYSNVEQDYGRSISATAEQAIPSPRPVKPNPSVVVALTLTCEMSRRRCSARCARIAGIWGANLGRSAMIVASTLLMV